jgi:MtN3 and saliva related transmembrane protein
MEEVVGLIAGTCTTLAFLPQVMQVWRTKSARDISLGMYIVFAVA